MFWEIYTTVVIKYSNQGSRATFFITFTTFFIFYNKTETCIRILLPASLPLSKVIDATIYKIKL